TVVHLSGNAGAGCVPGQTWFGFSFQHPQPGPVATGPVSQMTPPVAADGNWSATFAIPSYLGGSATRGLSGGPTVPGTYEFRAPTSCTSPRFASHLFKVLAGPAPGSAVSYVAMAPTPSGHGYWLAQADGVVTAFGDAPAFRPAGELTPPVLPIAPIVGMAATPDGHGLWLVGADGGVFAFGDAHFWGSLPGRGIHPRGVIVGMAATPDGGGYWLLGADGGVFTFGDAAFHGAGPTFSAPFDAISPAGTGTGYTLSEADSPDGRAGTPLAASLVGTAAAPHGLGHWQAGLDGGVVTSGDAHFYGSLPSEGIRPAAPVTAIAARPGGHGYWLLGADGGVFSFGQARFYGSAA
ncbi:MAG: hypothetical protein ACRDZY_11510, partial [Acidimicrobiales bacterium]